MAGREGSDPMAELMTDDRSSKDKDKQRGRSDQENEFDIRHSIGLKWHAAS
jgi:hypothetical protein